jgi:hypothetical protein
MTWKQYDRLREEDEQRDDHISPTSYLGQKLSRGVSAHVTNPKPESRKRVKARRDRQESKVEKAVREQTVSRDGHCLIASRLPSSIAVLLGPCEGPSEWAHVGGHRRCFTRGRAPEERHTTAGSGQLCKKHHGDYDAHLFDINTSDAIVGMDGEFAIVRRRSV